MVCNALTQSHQDGSHTCEKQLLLRLSDLLNVRGAVPVFCQQKEHVHFLSMFFLFVCVCNIFHLIASFCLALCCVERHPSSAASFSLSVLSSCWFQCRPPKIAERKIQTLNKRIFLGCWLTVSNYCIARNFRQRKISSKSDRPAVRQEFIFVKRRSSLVALRAFGRRSVAYRLSSHS